MYSIVNTAYFTWDSGQSSASCTIKKGDETMQKNCFNFNAVSIATKTDITTITVADGALQPLIAMCDCVPVSICINTSFEVSRECTRIVVTDGTTTLPIAKCNQYWRPRQLICNSTIYTEYRNNPQLLVFKKGVCHG